MSQPTASSTLCCVVSIFLIRTVLLDVCKLYPVGFLCVWHCWSRYTACFFGCFVVACLCFGCFCFGLPKCAQDFHDVTSSDALLWAGCLLGVIVLVCAVFGFSASRDEGMWLPWSAYCLYYPTSSWRVEIWKCSLSFTYCVEKFAWALNNLENLETFGNFGETW